MIVRRDSDIMPMAVSISNAVYSSKSPAFRYIPEVFLTEILCVEAGTAGYATA